MTDTLSENGNLFYALIYTFCIICNILLKSYKLKRINCKNVLFYKLFSDIISDDSARGVFLAAVLMVRGGKL